MKSLTPHEQRVLGLVRSNPKIIGDRKERERVAQANGMTEKTLRNRLADLKRYGLIGVQQLEPNGSPENEGLITNLEALWRRRKFIVINTFFLAAVSVGVSLLLPKWYKSQAVIISAGAGQTPSFLSTLSGLPLGNFGLSTLNEDITNYIAILESRTISEHMVERFNLVDRYDVKDVEYAIEAWEGNMELVATEEGALVISVLDKDPVVARDMVRALLEELEEMNRHLATQKGMFNRQFLEKRLEENRKELSKSENALREFQKRYGAVEIAEQVTAGIEAYSQLYAQKVDADIQFKVAQATSPENDPKLKQLALVLGELDNRLDSLVFGSDDESVLLAFGDIPDLSLEYARLLREVEIQNQIMQIILPQYEQARMDESKNVPTLQVIDEPKVAINKSKPKRALIVIATTLMAFVLALIYILVEFRTREIRARLRTV